MKIVIPEISEEDLFLKTLYGSFNEKYRKKIISKIKHEPFFESPKINLDRLVQCGVEVGRDRGDDALVVF